MNIWRSLTASSSFALILTLWAPAQADLIKADVVGFSSTGGAPFNLTSELAGPGPFSSPSASVAIVSPTEPFTFVEGPCAGVLCVQSTAHPVIGPGPSMSLSGNLDSFVLPPCFDLCGRSLSVNGTFVFDDFVITSADPSIRVVETSFNALLKGSVFVFAINPGTEAFAHVGVRLLASDCSDTPSQFYESCARGGNLIQVAQNNNLTLVARNTSGSLSSVFGSGAFAPLNEPGTSLATTFTIPVDLSATSPTFLAPVGRPFSVGLAVDTEMQVFFPVPFAGQSPVFGRDNIDFGDPISFPTRGPVFNLPAGFTVNSPRAGVVNNRFVGGPGSDTTPPVTTAALSPLPNAAGWNNTNATVTLTSTDNEPNGTGVTEIHFALAGAQGGRGVASRMRRPTSTLVWLRMSRRGRHRGASVFKGAAGCRWSSSFVFVRSIADACSPYVYPSALPRRAVKDAFEQEGRHGNSQRPTQLLPNASVHCRHRRCVARITHALHSQRWALVLGGSAGGRHVWNRRPS